MELFEHSHGSHYMELDNKYIKKLKKNENNVRLSSQNRKSKDLMIRSKHAVEMTLSPTGCGTSLSMPNCNSVGTRVFVCIVSSQHKCKLQLVVEY